MITDGAIHAIDSVVQIARESKQRVFVVGIGSSPAEGHLRLLAESTGGACDFIAPGEVPGPAILRMFARLSTPCWEDVEVVWPVQPVWQSVCPSLFDGDTYHASALFAERPAGEVLLNATNKNGERSHFSGAQILHAADGHDTLARMAALSRFRAMIERTPKEQIALDYCLLTAYTNFVLVHERAVQDKAVDMPALHVVPQMMAAGASGFGTVCGTRSPHFSRATVVSAGMDARPLRAPALWRRADVLQSTPPDPGLTPMALASLLSSGLKDTIEVSYAGLEEAGVGKVIVAWLEREFGDLDEYLVVWTFLSVMDAEPMRSQLLRRKSVSDIVGKVRAFLRSDPVSAQEFPADVDGCLAQQLLFAMSAVTAGHWGGLGGAESVHAEIDIPSFLRKQSD